MLGIASMNFDRPNRYSLVNNTPRFELCIGCVCFTDICNTVRLAFLISNVIPLFPSLPYGVVLSFDSTTIYARSNPKHLPWGKALQSECCPEGCVLFYLSPVQTSSNSIKSSTTAFLFLIFIYLFIYLFSESYSDMKFSDKYSWPQLTDVCSTW